MNNRKFFSIALVLLCTVIGVSSISAQGRFANRYNRMQVQAFVQQLETSSDAFHNDLRRQINRTDVNDSRRRQYLAYADQFESAVDRLRTRFSSNDVWWESRNEVRDLVTNSRNLNTLMNNAAFRRPLERQWNGLRDAINRLADTYDLPGLNGAGWTGGNWNPGAGRAGNVPAWARGTFYGRSRETGSPMTLTIEASGNVAIELDGQVVYAWINGTTLTNGPYVSRLSRINNGIRTTNVNNRNDYIDYFRTPQSGGYNPNPGYPNNSGYPNTGGVRGDVPTWSVGTFYGRNPETGGTIVLTVQRNGNVSISMDGNTTTYASMNGTTLTNGQYVSRVTRLNNGIRTTDVNSGSYIDYFRRR